LVAVPTDALHHPPCGECDRRELDCVVNITGGACCLCRKHKRRCEYSKPRPKKPASRNPVSGPDEGTAPPVPRTSVLRKTRCKFALTSLKPFLNQSSSCGPWLGF
jgi:hypothetical protein